MPEPSKYKAGYGLKEGKVIDGYKLQDIKIDHITQEKYKTYTYPTSLTFVEVKKGGDMQDLVNTFHSEVEGERIIYTSYGNPYECDFGGVHEIKGYKQSNGNVIITAEGICLRV
jgi:hypothetical protein